MYEGIVIRGHSKWSGVPFTKPTRLENDNSLGRDGGARSHVDASRTTAMRAVFCQECVELGMFDLTHVPAASMTAHLLTKWLSLNDFAKHRGKLTNRRAQYKMLVFGVVPAEGVCMTTRDYLGFRLPEPMVHKER